MALALRSQFLGSGPGLPLALAGKMNRDMSQLRIDKYITIIVALAILCTTALIWGVFIWPTPYQYEKVTRPWYTGTKQEIYRINRFTGTAEKVVDPTPKTDDD
jgi:hypothetical protein